MKIILLTYINRSGSTFLASELNKHKNILSCPEAEILVNMLLEKPLTNIGKNWKIICDRLLTDNKFRNWGLPQSSYWPKDCVQNRFDLFCHFLSEYKKNNKPDASYVLFKAERLFQLIPKLWEIEPVKQQIVVLSIIRDIRSVICSQQNTFLPGTNSPFSLGTEHTALFWNSYANFFLDHKIPKINIKFEGLVNDYNKTYLQIIKKLALPISEIDMSKPQEYFNKLPKEHQTIHKNIISGPLPERSKYWIDELPRAERRIIEFISKNQLIKLNYKMLGENSLKVFEWVYVNLSIFKVKLKKLTKKIFFNRISND